MSGKIDRRKFITGPLLAGVCAPALNHVASAGDSASGVRRTAPARAGTLPSGKLGRLTLSRLISGGNILSGWCHQRDLLFVSALAKAYLTQERQFSTVQAMEEAGVNGIAIDMVQLDLLNQYKQQRGGKIQTIVAVRQGWGNWDNPSFKDLREQIQQTIDRGPDALFLHGGYSDRIVQSGQPERIEILGHALEFIRSQGIPAGLGAHALEVPVQCQKQGMKPDFFFKTFHHDQYWSATPRSRRRRFCVDGPRSLDHNEFHDNIFCIDPDETAEFMLDQDQPWIAFKVLAAGAIHPRSAFKYAFENGADFLAVGMFDFELGENVQVLKEVIKDLRRERPWRS
jgi:hypothetical protein